MKRILSLALVAVLLAAAAAQTPAPGGAAEGTGCPFTLSLPWTYANDTVVDLSEKVEVEGEDNPLAVTTVCTCPVVAEPPTVCTCEGPKSDDCDSYAEILSGFFLFAEKFMGVFMHIGEFAAKYHIEHVAFWAILGSIFTWIGMIIILYSEIKAVIITRERDERDKLVEGGYLAKNSSCQDLFDREEGSLAPRPYLTIGGGILFWVGMLCQFVPFCHILGLIFPGLVFFHGLCIVFVVVGTLVLAASTFLFVIGLCWSCTRPWAASVLIVVALLGDVMIFGGLISIAIWIVLAGAAFWAYFSYAPNYYEENKVPQPDWLQSLGNWYKVGTSVDEWKEASTKGYESAVAESRDFVKTIPYGKESLSAADAATDLAKKAADEAQAAAQKAADEAKAMASKTTGQDSGSV
uniref:Vitamin K epoxide reductase domain-containing protein n=2 Tax=Hemiselmis andersenii TaxID=464988 RepID=A0A6T8PCL0_HEMAN|mmetsp:Transcript_25777/g.59796  ORF Transcript_25777/g.59796 Transcript_25777/m.59796 type:complete len:407 (+) Transcript_25777:34-1254(+)